MAKTYKIIPFRIDEKQYRMLKKIAYLHDKPMSVIIRDLIHLEIQRQKSVLTNSDIAI